MKKKIELLKDFTTLGKIFIVSISILGLIVLASIVIVVMVIIK